MAPDLVWLLDYLRQLGETAQKGLCRKDSVERLKFAFEELWQKKFKHSAPAFVAGIYTSCRKLRFRPDLTIFPSSKPNNFVELLRGSNVPGCERLGFAKRQLSKASPARELARLESVWRGGSRKRWLAAWAGTTARVHDLIWAGLPPARSMYENGWTETVYECRPKSFSFVPSDQAQTEDKPSYVSMKLVPVSADVLSAILAAKARLPGRVRRPDSLKRVTEEVVIRAYEEISGRPAKASYNNSKKMRTGPFVDFVQNIDYRLKTQLAPGIYDRLNGKKKKLAHKRAAIPACSGPSAQ
jgi:hypothetical protein